MYNEKEAEQKRLESRKNFVERNKFRRKYNEAQLAFFHTRNRDRVRRAWRKLGGKCAKCPETKMLDFDHIKVSNKRWCITNMAFVNDALFWKEVAKCQLLCKKCHAYKTKIDMKEMREYEGWGTPYYSPT